MPSRDWVVDTWVLKTVENLDDSRCHDALDFLLEVKNNHRIILDEDREIEKEYWRNMKPRTHVSKWWKSMQKVSGKIIYKAGTLSNEAKGCLLNDLGFDPADIKFVNVAYSGDPGLLVSEDGDYTTSVKEYLRDEVQIECLGVFDALARAKDP